MLANVSVLIGIPQTIPSGSHADATSLLRLASQLGGGAR